MGASKTKPAPEPEIVPRLSGRHARRGRFLTFPTPLSPETKDVKATIWHPWVGGWHRDTPEAIQKLAQVRVDGFAPVYDEFGRLIRGITRAQQFEGYAIFSLAGKKRSMRGPR